MSQSETALDHPTPWITTAEAAAYLRVKPRTLLLWVRQGKITAYPLSGVQRRVWRFRCEDLDSSLTASRVLPSLAPSVLVKGLR